jgi:hypothetical protein
MERRNRWNAALRKRAAAMPQHGALGCRLWVAGFARTRPSPDIGARRERFRKPVLSVAPHQAERDAQCRSNLRHIEPLLLCGWVAAAGVRLN